MTHANSFNSFKEAREFLKKNLKESINCYEYLIDKECVKKTWYGGRIVYTRRFRRTQPYSGLVLALREMSEIEPLNMFVEDYKVKLKEKETQC